MPRTSDPNGVIMPNGLYLHQNKRIQELARIAGIPAANFQRRLIDFCFAAIDSDEYLSLFDEHPLLKPKQD